MHLVNWHLVENLLHGFWSGVGPLVGVFVGWFLTSRVQRRRWVADRKLAEYRDLLDAITDTYGKLANLQTVQLDDVQKLKACVMNKVHDRILIHSSINELNVFSKWVSACDSFAMTKDRPWLFDEIWALVSTIKDMAMKDISE